MRLKRFHIHKWELYGKERRYYFLGEPIYYTDPRLEKCSICGKIKYREKNSMIYGTLTGVKKEIVEQKIKEGYFVRMS